MKTIDDYSTPIRRPYPKFSMNTFCPKCGYAPASVKHKPFGRYFRNAKDSYKEEFLERTCQTCGFKRREECIPQEDIA